MNKIYKVVWNKNTQRWDVASELTHSNGKKSTKSSVTAVAGAVAALAGVAGDANAAIVDTSSVAKIEIGVGANLANAATNWGTAVGASANATGDNSAAFGAFANATGSSSVAVGLQANATGASSLALGSQAKALENQGTAVGSWAIAGKQLATALGTQANASAERSIAVGYGSTSGRFGNIAIGATAAAGKDIPADDAIKPTGYGYNSIAIGNNAIAHTNATALGVGANSGNVEGNIAIGYNAVVENSTNDAGVPYLVHEGAGHVWYNNQHHSASTPSNITRVANGGSSSNTIYNPSTGQLEEIKVVQIKRKDDPESSFTTATTSGIAIGKFADADSNGIVIGERARAKTKKLDLSSGTQESLGLSIAIGSLANAEGGGIALGSASEASSFNTFAVGRQAVAKGLVSNAIGSVSAAVGNGSTAIGHSSQALGERSIAFGSAGSDKVYALVDSVNGTFVAQTSADAIAIGSKAKVNENSSYAISFGHGTNTSGENAIAIGNGAQALAKNALSVGVGNIVRGEASGAFGDPTEITGAGSYSIGNDNGTGADAFSADNAGIFGNNNVLKGDNSRIVGNNNNLTAAATNTFVMGNGVQSALANSVILGNASDGSAVFVPTSEATVAGITYSGFEGVSKLPNGVVSIGSAGKERQIKHVAAGQITETSTDAINGSQLYAVAKTLGQGWTAQVNGAGGQAIKPGDILNFKSSDNSVTITQNGKEIDFKVVGSSSAPQTTTLDVANTAPNAGSVSVSGTGNDAKFVTAKEIADTINKAGFTLTASGANGSLVNAGESVDLKAGDSNIVISKEASNNDVSFKLNDTVVIGTAGAGKNPVTINGTAGTIGGLTNKTFDPASITSGQAASEDQLKALWGQSGINVTAAKVNNGTVSGEGAKKVGNGDTLTIAADNGIAITQSDKQFNIGVKVDDSTIGINAEGKLFSKVTGGSAPQTTNLAVTGGKVDDVAAGEANKLVTADNLAKTINQTGFNTGLKGSVFTTGATMPLVKPGDTLNFGTDGDGIQVGYKDGAITYRLNTGSGSVEAGKARIINGEGGDDSKSVANISSVVNLINDVGWNAQSGGNKATGDQSASTLVKAGDTVTFSAGDGLTVKRENGNFTFAANIDTNTLEFDNGKLKVKNVPTGGSVETTTLDVAQAGTAEAGKVSVTAPSAGAPSNDGKLVNAKELADTINEAGFTLSASGANGSLVNAGEKVDLNNTDKNIVISKDAGNNNVSFNLANTVTIGSGAGTNPVTINGTAGTIGGLTNKTFNPASITSGQAASEDQLKALWGQSGFNVTAAKVNNGTVSGEGSKKVGNGDTLTIAADNGIAITQSDKQFNIGVKVDDSTIGINSEGKLYSKVTGGSPASVEKTTLSVSDGSAGKPNKGAVESPATGEGDKLVSASNLADTLNKVGFTAKKANETDGELINAGDSLSFKEGKNIAITRTGSEFEIKTQDAVTFTSVTSNTITVPTGASTPAITINNAGMDMASKPITNLAGNLDGAKAGTVAPNKSATKPSALAESNAATVGDVLNAGFNIKRNDGTSTTDVDFVRAYDNVVFANGVGTVASVENTDGVNTTVKFNVAYDANTLEIDSAGKLKVKNIPTGGAAPTTTGLTVADTGTVSVTGGATRNGDLVTAGDLATTFNNTGIQVAQNGTVNQDGAGKPQLLNAGNTLDFANGSNTIANVVSTADGTTVKFDAATTALAAAINGAITAPAAAEGAKLVNATTLATAINGTGFTLSASGRNGSLVNPGESVDLKAGDNNIVISKVAGNNDVSFALANTVTIGSGAGTNPVTINGTAGTIGGLTNKTFNPTTSYTGGQAATQEQLKALWDQSGFKLTTSATTGGRAEGTTVSPVNNGATVNLRADNGIKLIQAGNTVGVGINVGTGLKINTTTGALEVTGATVPPTAPTTGDMYFHVNTGSNAGGNAAENKGSATDAAGAQAIGAVAAGLSAQATANNTIAVGTSANAGAQDAISVGNVSKATGEYAVAVGRSSNATGYTSIAIGQGAVASQVKPNEIDASNPRNNKYYGKSIAVGNAAQALGDFSVALGDASKATNEYAVAVGGQSTASGRYGLGIGVNANATGNFSMAIGKSANATGEFSTAIGLDSKAQSLNSTVLGRAATTSGVDAVAIARLANATGQDAMAIGRQASATANDAVAIGRQASSGANFSTAIGANTNALGERSLVVGVDAKSAAAANDAIAIGRKANVEAKFSNVIGYDSTVSSNYSTAIGQNNVLASTATSTYVLGEAGKGNPIVSASSVILGSGSHETSANHQGIADIVRGTGTVFTSATAVDKATVNGIEYKGFAGDDEIGGIVSVGSKDLTRQIINVAPGEISETSTDAINGSQLYMTNKALGNVAATTAKHLGGGVTVGTDGNLTAPTYAITDAADNKYLPTGKTADAANVGDAITNLNAYVNEGFTIKNNDGSAIDKVTPKDSVQFVNGKGTTSKVEADTTNNTTKISFDVNKAAITTTTGGVAETEGGDNDFATSEDVVKAINSAGFNLTAGGANGSLVTAGKTVDLKNTDGNIVVNKAATDNNVSFNLANKVTIGDATSGKPVTIDGTTGTIGGLTNKTFNPASITSGQAASEDQLKALWDNTGFKVTAGKVNDGTASGITEEKVGNGDLLTFKADNGINIKQDGKTFEIGAKVDGTTIGYDSRGNLTYIGKAGAETVGLTVEDAGSVKAPATADENKVVTAKDLADTFNKTGIQIAQEGTVQNDASGKPQLLNAGNTLNFANGNGTVADVTSNATGTTVKFNVAQSALTSNAATGTVTAATPNNFATAGSVATAINNAGFIAKTDGAGSADHLVKTGQTLNINQGNNIAITQNAGTFSIATKDDVTFTSVTSNTIKVPTGTGSTDPAITINKDGIDMAGKPITNATSALDTYTTAPRTGLVDLSVPATGAPAVSNGTVATVGDLRNMGFVVSSTETTGAAAGTAFSNQVRNAGEVKFVGTGAAEVSGSVNGDVNTITINVKPTAAPTTATIGADANAGTLGAEDPARAGTFVGGSKPSDTNALVKAGDVIDAVNNAFWSVSDGKATGGVTEKVKAGTTVNFVDGTGTQASVSNVGGKPTVTFNVAQSALNSNAATGTVTAATPDNFATAGSVADAINNAGFVVKKEGETTQKLIKTGETLSFEEGKNIAITRTDGKFAIATKDDVSFNNVSVGNTLTVGSGATATNLTSTSDGLKVAKPDGSATKITNVAAGTEDNDAVNFKQLKDTVGAASGSWRFKTSGNTTESTIDKTNNVVTFNGSDLINVTHSAQTVTISATKGTLTPIAAGTSGKTAGTVEAPVNGIATTSDVATAINSAFWTADDGKTATPAQNIKAGTAVQFIDGTGTTSSVNVDASGNPTVTFNVAQSALTSDTAKGTVTATTPDNFATAGSVATAINNAGFIAKTNGAGSADHLVKTGQTLNINQGNNIAITQNAGTFSIATKDDVTFTSVTSNTIKVPTGTGSDAITINKDGIDMAGKPITNATSALDTYTTAPRTGLVDLSIPATGAPAVSNGTVATVGDLRNMGFVVSADKKTGDLSNSFSNQVRNAGEVKFVGTGLATVSANNAGDVNTITVDVNAQNVVNNAQLPVVYTKADGTKVVKAADGKFYDATAVNADGSLIGTPTEVQATDVIASMNNGANSTTTAMALGNIKSNLADATNSALAGGTRPATHTSALAAPATSGTGAGAVNVNNAATVGDVLNSGFNLQANGEAVDFVKAYDTVNFVDGRGTQANVGLNDDGTIANISFNSALGYVNTTSTDTSTPSDKAKLFGNSVGGAEQNVQLGNVASGVRGTFTPATAGSPTSAEIVNAIKGANGDTLNNAVNVGDLKATLDQAVAAGNTKVESPNKTITVDSVTDSATGATTYKIDVARTGLKVSDGTVPVGAPVGTVATPAGKIEAPSATDATKFVNAGDLATAINGAGFRVFENNANAKALVSAGDQVSFNNGTYTTAVVGDESATGLTNVTFNVDGSKIVGDNSPVVYTKADGTKVFKQPDGSFKDAAGNVYTGDVIASMQAADGKTVNAPTLLANVQSNLAPTTSSNNLIGKDGTITPVTEPTKAQSALAEADAAKLNNNAATVGDVLNAGWNLQANGNAADFVRAYDTVNFANGTGTTASITSTGNTNTITFNVKQSALNVGDGVKTITGGTTIIPKGTVEVPADDNSFATAKSVAEAINKVGFIATATATAEGKVSGTTEQLIKAGNTVTFEAGKGVSITQDASKFTFAVDAQKLAESAQLPVVYTNEAGDKLAKVDGKFYKEQDIDAATGKPKAGVSEVPATDVIASMNSGTNSVSAPTTLANVKSHLDPSTSNTSLIGKDGSITAVAAPTKALSAPSEADAANWNNHAASVGDVLNAGWNLQADGNAVDFVKAYDTVNFKAGANTQIVTDTDGAATSIQVNMVGLPVAYTTANGVPVAKVGDKYYEIDANGKPDMAKPVADASKLLTNVVNPTARPNDIGGLTSIGNIDSGIKALDGTHRGDKATGSTAIDASTPIGANVSKAYNGLADLKAAPQNNAVTAKDLGNLGWVVSATGNDYAADVRHANEVRFEGKGLAKVSGETNADGVRVITVDVDAQKTFEAAQTPVVYTNEDGDKLVKVDGKFYKEQDIDATTGKPKTGVSEVPAGDVIASMNSGNNVTTEPTRLANIKGNLAEAQNSALVGGTRPTTHTSALAAPTATEAAKMKNNAATVGDVLNSGFNLQANGEAVDFVKAYDTVNFVNGRGTQANITLNGAGTVADITFNSALGYVNKDPSGAITSDTSTPSNTVNLFGGDVTKPVQMGNLASGVRDQLATIAAPTGKQIAEAISNAPRNTLNNAVNVGDLKAIADASKTKVISQNGTVGITETTDNTTGAKTFDLSVSAGKVVTEASPVVYTKGDGTKVVKANDGNFYNPADVNVDGSPKTGVTAVPKADVIASMQSASGDTKAPTTLANVKSNLEEAINAPASAGTHTKEGKAPTNPDEIKNNAATVGDVLNSGWTLQENGTSKDFVKAYDKVNFVNGVGTQANVTMNADGTVANITFNSALGYVNTANPADQSTPTNTVKLIGGDTSKPVAMTNMASGVRDSVVGTGTGGAITDGDVVKAIKDARDETLNNAVNVGDLRAVIGNTSAAIAAAKTEVESSDGSIKVDQGVATGGGVKYDIKVATTKLAIGDGATGGTPKGQVATPVTGDANKFVNAGDLATAINNVGFNLGVGAVGTGVVSSSSGDELISAGKRVQLNAGNNIAVTQAANGQVTFATKDDVTFKSVTSNTITVPTVTGGAAGKPITINQDGIKAGDKVIGDVASGVSATSGVPVATAGTTYSDEDKKKIAGAIQSASGTTLNNAANIGDLQAIANNIVATTGATLVTKPTNPVAKPTETTVEGIKDLKTYNVHGQTEQIDHKTLVEGMNAISEKGTKFFHTNDGQGFKRQESNSVDSSAAGMHSTAIGYRSFADGDASVSLGANAHAKSASSVAIGNTAKAEGENAIAIGINSQATGVNAIAIGNGNVVTGRNSGAFGDPSRVEGDASYTFGNDNYVAAGQSNVFTLGNNVTKTTSNSVFLGNQSASFEQEGAAQGKNGVHQAVEGVSHYTYAGLNDANVAGVSDAVGIVSVGNATQTRQIQGVAAGVVSATSTDAINGSQLYDTHRAIGNVQNQVFELGDALNKSNKDLRAGIAGANAAAGLPQAYLPGKSMVAAAAGTFKGQVALAVGYSEISDNGKLIFKVQGNANTRGDVGASVGLGYQW